MKIRMFCGKGGVGKTTVAVATAHYLAGLNESTVIIDYDGGISVARTLGIKNKLEHNVLISDLGGGGLLLCAIDGDGFEGIAEWKKRDGTLSGYLAQFPDDMGIVPIADMINAFFGVPTDPSATLKFSRLIRALEEARSLGAENVIIDVEPTSGLSRFLTTASMTVKCLRNLHSKGRFSLMALGLAWPDISTYLKGEYISRADFYSDRLERVVTEMIDAQYYLVCMPEAGPVDQMTEVKSLIENFGGVVRGYIVNNLRGEVQEVALVTSVSNRGLPVARLNRDPEFHSESSNRQAVLSRMGESLNRQLSLTG
jgi:anion-transporting  ArsA/GET3 family ATPase